MPAQTAKTFLVFILTYLLKLVNIDWRSYANGVTVNDYRRMFSSDGKCAFILCFSDDNGASNRLYYLFNLNVILQFRNSITYMFPDSHNCNSTNSIEY